MVSRTLLCGLFLGVTSVAVYAYADSRRTEAGVPMFERQAADRQACEVAEAAIAEYRAPSKTTFTSDCLPQIVTRLWNRSGFVIVTRSTREPDTSAGGKRHTYSVLLDGRQSDRWQIVDIRATPDVLTLDISMLPLEEKQEDGATRSASKMQ